MRWFIISLALLGGIHVQAKDQSTELGKIAGDLMQEAQGRLHPQQILIALSEVESGKILTVAFHGEGKDSHDLNSLVYEPASTLKPFVVGTALECGAVKADTRLDCKEAEVAGHRIRNVNPADQLTPPEILRTRNNMGMVRIGESLSDKQLYDGLKVLGFGVPPGFLPSPAEWIGETKVRLAIGQSMLVTPMELLWAYGVLANEGRKPGERERLLTRVTARTITRAITRLPERVTGIPIATASSTSQAVRGEQYVKGRFVTQTIGYFPADHPRYIAQVVVDGAKVPTAENTAALVAEPIFRKFVEESAPILGLRK